MGEFRSGKDQKMPKKSFTEERQAGLPAALKGWL
jgi:hypothetical protein